MRRLTTVLVLVAATSVAVLPAIPATASCGGAYPDDPPPFGETVCAVESTLCRLTRPPSECIPPP